MWTPGTADAFKAATAMAVREIVPADITPIRGLVQIAVVFYMPRPKRMMGRKWDPGAIPHGARPDIDNLSKALIDAIVDSGVLADDAPVWSLSARKYYAEADGHARAEVMIEYGEHDGEID